MPMSRNECYHELIKSRRRDPHLSRHTFLPHLYPSKVGKEHSTYSSAETMPKTETERAEVFSIDLSCVETQDREKNNAKRANRFQPKLWLLLEVLPACRNSTTRLSAGQSSTEAGLCGAVTKCFDKITR